jgi:hypothetical protein
MITKADLPKALDRMDNTAMLAIGREFGMTPPTRDELPEACALAAALMDHEVVDVETLATVLSIQPAAAVVYREEGRITGVSGQLILTARAWAPLLAGAFDALVVDPAVLAREGERVALGYGWGVAGSTKPARYAVNNALSVIRERLFPNITAFTKAVTPIGRHVCLTRFGYEPLRHEDDDLLISLPANLPRTSPKKELAAA